MDDDLKLQKIVISQLPNFMLLLVMVFISEPMYKINLSLFLMLIGKWQYPAMDIFLFKKNIIKKNYGIVFSEIGMMQCLTIKALLSTSHVIYEFSNLSTQISKN